MKRYRVTHGSASREIQANGFFEAARLGFAALWRDYQISGNKADVLVTDTSDGASHTYTVSVTTEPRFFAEFKQ